ncbi:MAG: D-glycero-beta-D-manno-heptose 1-phosphate adenylyltransferase [Bacteroidota bacterium]|nr:D-glycero-beta-D-manno-heptose 1-phosphate adenylyltransferase [Bacteroidota bacterium]
MKAKDKIFNKDGLILQIQKWKDEKLEVVFTNGCFDIIHLGHIEYLEKAREKGDKLIVGVNSDSSVRRLKGTSRPIIEENSRVAVLASLMFVDAVIVFEEDTPLELIMALQPDILIKGNDYSLNNIVGADFVISQGGKVKTIELVPGFSTTSIVEKIQSN